MMAMGEAQTNEQWETANAEYEALMKQYDTKMAERDQAQIDKDVAEFDLQRLGEDATAAEEARATGESTNGAWTLTDDDLAAPE